VNTVKQWIQEARDRIVPAQIHQQAQNDRLNRIAKLLDESNVPLEAIDAIQEVKFNSWGVFAKNAKGELETRDLYSTKIVLTPTKKYPEYPVIQPAPPAIVKFDRPKPVSRKLDVAIVYPDQQFGFRRSLERVERLIPFHDDAAIDVAMQITADIRPRRVVDIGDILDFNEFSRWFQHVEFYRTTQPAIDRAARYFDERKAAANGSIEEEDVCGGNHDERSLKYVEEHARNAFHVRKADETPSSWPPFSLPWFLNFDKRGIRYTRYPGSEVWLVEPNAKRRRPGLLCTHEKPGKHDYFASVINGHDHTVESNTETVRVSGGHVALTRWSAGCLCRVDDQTDRLSQQRIVVPSDRGYVKKWQQALVVVYVDRSDSSFQVDTIHINSGKAMYRDRAYVASKRK
jgi:hypothetical protein